MLKLRQRPESEEIVSLGGCARHSFDRATGSCRSCRDAFCADCLVHPFGTNKPGLCVNCALVRAGIRR